MCKTNLLRVAGCAGVLLLGAGCGALDVNDPTRIDGSDLENAASADFMRKDAVSKLYQAVGSGALASGILADEFFSNPPSWYEQLGITSSEQVLDQRRSERYEELDFAVYRGWTDVRRAATVAIPRLRTYMADPERSAYIGQMFAGRGYATLRLAEDFCPGLPLNEVVGYTPVYGPPLSTEEVLGRAIEDFDSALVYAVDSARFADFARVGRARALLGLGRFDEAAAAALPVATEYVWNAEFSSTFDPYQPNPLFFGEFGSLDRSLSDREGGTGLDFVSAGDPRVQPALVGTAEDGETLIYANARYPDTGGTVAIVSGLEARLIEAEADLKTGGTAWLGVLNQLRATQISPSLDPLADPGSAEARVDLLFRERAFWLFSTGHRLGDLRRLVRQYGRAADSVFPSGPFWSGGSYDAATSIPFPAKLESAYNSAVTGCTSR